MSRMHRRSPAVREWEDALIGDYADMRWREVLDPLYEQFQRWKAGELDHADMDEAIHKTHRECQKVYVFFSNRRDELLQIIQWQRDWFEPWLAAHPAPPGIELERYVPWSADDEPQ